MQTIISNKPHHKKVLWASLIFSIFLIGLNSCRNDNFFEGDTDLTNSVDTLRFDTVFTELGSATRYVKVFNDESENLQITNVSLESGDQSFFRMNINGESGNELTDVTIPPNDSIYIFVEVTIDPDNPLSVSPFIIEDKILMNVNGSEHQVYLEAWGQNAIYIPSKNQPGAITLLPCTNGNTVWDDPKPYVIYGILFIDDCTLTIAPGTQVYVHGGVVSSDDLGVYNDGLILIGENGQLRSKGTLQDTIVFQGDRLETGFQDASGQWQGIRFLSQSNNNEIDFTTIKNSIFGIWLDSLAEANVSYSKIYNTSSVGVVNIHADMNMQNTLIHSNGSHALQCTYGGNYNFDYCTFASYGNDKEAIRLDNYLCRDPFCFEFSENPLTVSMTNTIISGSQRDELFMDDISEGATDLYNYSFTNTIVKVDTLLESAGFTNFFNNCDDCINLNSADNDTLFVDIDISDYHLDTMSVAEQKGIPILSITDDLDGKARDSNTPDIGCYEFQQ